MSAEDIETERLWDEMKRKNPSLYDSEYPAPLIEPHAKKREARKAYAERLDKLVESFKAKDAGSEDAIDRMLTGGGDYPMEEDFVELDMAESDSSTSVHTDEMDYSEEEEWYEEPCYEEEWQREREEASYHYDYDIDDYVDSSGNKAPWC